MEKFLTVPEIAERTGKHEETIRRWIREGVFEGIRKGAKNMSLIPESSLNKFLSSSTAHHHKFIDILTKKNIASSDVWPLSVGKAYTFAQIKTITNCPTIRGIRYRNGSPELSIITSLSEVEATSQYNPYEDRFENGLLMYTGEGQKGDQKLSGGNLKLYEAIPTSQPVHVFQKLQVDNYLFCGLFTVIGYQIEKQPGSDGKIRDAFVFRLKPIVQDPDSSNSTPNTKSPEEKNDEQALLETMLDLQKNLKKEKISVETLQKRYKRSRNLVETLKKLYHYECQLCDPANPIPEIQMKKGKKYVEVHHILGFAEVIGDLNDQQSGDFVIDQYNNVICCCAHHHRVLHHYRSKMIFNKEEMAFIAEDGSLTLPIHLRHDWHTFE